MRKKYSFAGFMRPRTACILAATIVLAGCGNKSSVCSTDEVVQNLSDLSKSNMLMFDMIRSETEDPPFRNDKAWIDLSKSLTNLKTKLEANDAKLESEKATCSALPAEKMNEQSANRLGFVGAMAFMQLTVGFAALSPAEKNSIYKNLCSGDFSSLSQDPAWGSKFFDALMPNRYRAWYEKVRPLTVEAETLSKLISDKELTLSEYENSYFENSFKSVKYNFSESSLDSQNDSETNYTCSSKISSELKGWKNIEGTINYIIKITDSGKSKVEIIQDSDFEKLAPLVGSYDNGLDTM